MFVWPTPETDRSMAFHNEICHVQAYGFVALFIWCAAFLKKEPNYARGALIVLAAIALLMTLGK